jgi:hypothetical protein
MLERMELDQIFEVEEEEFKRSGKLLGCYYAVMVNESYRQQTFTCLLALQPITTLVYLSTRLGLKELHIAIRLNGIRWSQKYLNSSFPSLPLDSLLFLKFSQP